MQLSLFRSEPPPRKEPVHDRLAAMKQALQPHLPAAAIDYIIDWLIANKVQLRISRTRTSKLGDYRYPQRGSIAKISVNHSLNPYSFLITLVHEMAHHRVYVDFTSSVKERSLLKKRKPLPKPHGDEWKSAYLELMRPVMNSSVFPCDVLMVLTSYLENPRASSKGDRELAGILMHYDAPSGKETLETLPFDSVFRLPNGRTFRKKEKVRTRYKCVCLKTNRIYLFNPLAEVHPS